MLETVVKNPVKTLQSTIIFTIVKFLLIGSIFGLLFWQGKQFLDKKTQDLSEKRAMIFVFQKREVQGKKLQEDYEKVEEDFPRIENALPSKDDLTPLIAGLESIAGSSGCQQTLSFEEKEIIAEGTGYPALGFQINLTCNLSQALAYLTGLHNFLYVIKIEKIEFTSSQSLQKEGGGKIFAKIYFQKETTTTDQSLEGQDSLTSQEGEER